MFRKTKFITVINLLFLFSALSFGQEITKNFQGSFYNSNLIKVNNNYSLASLYNNSNNNFSANTSSLFNTHLNFFELKSCSKKSLTELKVELESVPVADNILKLQTSTDGDNKTEESKSFFQSEIFYFACAAVLATTAYMIWKKNDEPVNKSQTFGTPPLPQNN